MLNEIYAPPLIGSAEFSLDGQCCTVKFNRNHECESSQQMQCPCVINKV